MTFFLCGTKLVVVDDATMRKVNMSPVKINSIKPFSPCLVERFKLHPWPLLALLEIVLSVDVGSSVLLILPLSAESIFESPLVVGLSVTLFATGEAVSIIGDVTATVGEVASTVGKTAGSVAGLLSLESSVNVVPSVTDGVVSTTCDVASITGKTAGSVAGLLSVSGEGTTGSVAGPLSVSGEGSIVVIGDSSTGGASSTVQVLLHPSPEIVLPSSQFSKSPSPSKSEGTVLTKPSPHTP